ncbi:MAG: hypothetical protein JST93_17935 [Acidobacteria bacterium]|nr:hypothetical protein [Acidobacteriota bacterium]
MHRLALPVFFAVALTFTGCDFDDFEGAAREKEDFHHTKALKSGGRIEIENFNGGIEITGWDKETVEIHGTKHAPTKELLDAIHIDIDSTPDSLRIKTVRPTERRGNLGVKYVLSVPRKVILERIVSSNGGIRVDHVEGNVKLRTSNGGVRVEMVKGDLDVTTSNGGIDLTEFTGGAALHSSNGAIRADGVRGFFEATTSNGGIDARILETSGTRPVRVSSSNGRVNLTIEGLKNTDVIASTSNSSLTVKLPASVGAQLKASTSNSSISTEFEVKTSGTISKNRMEGTIGSGGPVLDLHTSNGSIRVLKL